VDKWYLPTISEVIALSDLGQGSTIEFPAQQRLRAEREWYGAIAALNVLLLQMPNSPQRFTGCQGIVLSGLLPVLIQPELVTRYSSWTFTSDRLQAMAWMPLNLLPAAEKQAISMGLTSMMLPLLPNDPLAAEQFCLVLTPTLSLIMALGENTQGEPRFLFSFDPEVVTQGWRAMRSRLALTQPDALNKLDTLYQTFPPIAPDYRVVARFSRLMMDYLPEPSLGTDLPQDTQPTPSGSANPPLEHLTQAQLSSDVELLQAIAHEVRTPLTTIRTLTRLLLKRKDLNADVLKRLDIIDQECTRQIDRFGLIFRAVELETANIKRPMTPLAPISLAQVLQQNVPRWQEQARQRNLTLDVTLPQKLPMVLADPTMLDQVLTGLIDRITVMLPPGSHIQANVTLAGHQLKLQFQSQSSTDSVCNGHTNGFSPTLKSIGEMLMFQPETGNLSLNLSVTKNLFQALGGKLTVRNKAPQGEILTVFLPLETARREEA
jgi:signal transduction histidine kinase